jgi:transcriptional regulator with XRE-family HTH domain
MSYIGKNIRKIRSIKNYSQTDFADKFELKRATVGAYEEGRSEPKIATLIDIANYFSISVDDLLKKELTVNDLFKFDIFKKELQKSGKHNLKPSELPIDLVSVPLLTALQNQEWATSPLEVNTLEQLVMPLPKGDDYLALEIADKAMEHLGQGVAQGDIIIGRKPKNKTDFKLEEGRTYLLETQEGFLVRKVTFTEAGYWLKTLNEDYYSTPLNKAALLDFWQIALRLTKRVGAAQQNKLKQKDKAT